MAPTLCADAGQPICSAPPMPEPTSLPVFAPTRARPCPTMRGRGVYLSDMFLQGAPVLVAVDSMANVLEMQPWREDTDLPELYMAMLARLDVADPPRPSLRLLRGASGG